MIEYPQKECYGFDDLVEIVRLLRTPEGCPWDREQNHRSIRRNFIEEVYEACEAIDTDDPVLLQEELGDVLLQVVFHANMEQERGRFDADAVCDGVCRKLLRRHPHVFGARGAADADTALANWEEIKKQEHDRKSTREVLEGVSKTLPSLLRGEKLVSKAAKNSIAVPSTSEAVRSIAALAEKTEAVDGAEAGELLGELLMQVCALAHAKQLDPEEALERAGDRFIVRNTGECQ